MNRIAHAPQSFEFCFPQLDTLVLVESTVDGVLVRATRDTFSEERKHCFIRELAAEGFIPNECRWTQWHSFDRRLNVDWRIDYSWLELNPAMIASTRRFMLRLLGGGILLWLGMMALLISHASR